MSREAQWSVDAATLGAIQNGRFAATSVGDAVVTAMLDGQLVAARVVVTPALVVALSVSPSDVSVEAGSSVSLRAVAKLNDGSARDVTGDAAWSVQDARVAQADSNGMVTGLGGGTTGISVAYRGMAGAVSITVTAPSLVSVQVTPAAFSLRPGQQVQLSVSARYANGTSREVAGKTRWSSNPQGVVSVSLGGLVTAIDVGHAEVLGFFQGRPVQSVVDVSGGGIALLTLSKNAHDFENVEVGSPAEVVLTVANAGSGPAQFGTIYSGGLGLSAQYSLASSTCPSGGALAPSETCTLTVRVVSEVMGTSSGVVSLGDTGGSSASVACTLSAQSIYPVVLALTDTSACARRQNGTVKCWGDNGLGQPGLGNTSAKGDQANEMGNNLPSVSIGTGRTAKALVGGAGHFCALLDNATVKCWGDNASGQLGVGSTLEKGDNGNEMGDNLAAVALGTGRSAMAIAAGLSHSCALLDDDTLKCWGYNQSGALGLGDMNNRDDGANEMGNSLLAADLGTGRRAAALTVGRGFHTCAVLDNATVKCWGYNQYGGLGLGDFANYRGDAPNEMGDNLPAISLGAGRTVKSIVLGSQHTCAVRDDNSVKCWGSNSNGQLGLGDTSNRGDGANEMGDSLPVVDLGSL